MNDADDLQDRLSSIAKAFERIKVKSGNRVDAAVESSSALSLNQTPTASSLQSSEEINTEATSISTTQPSFNNASTSSPLIGGRYNGEFDDTLIFSVTRGGNYPSGSPIQVEVRNASNDLIDVADFAPNGSVDDEVQLSNGLSLSFSAGFIDQNDTFELDVFANTETDVDPNASFDGVGDAAPGFDFGQAVSAGSFNLNGTSIVVGASDSINDVLTTINNSGAGVTATFDVANDSISLISNSTGSQSDITLDSDTSGFLAATKLSQDHVVGALDDERTVAFSAVTEFSGISAGTITVNGKGFFVDPNSDSLDDLVAQIDASVEGVTASFDNGVLNLEATTPGGDLVLDSGATGFFSALRIDDGTYLGEYSKRGVNGVSREQSRSDLRRIEDAFEDLAKRFDSEAIGSEGRLFTAQLKSALSTFFRDNDLSQPNSDVFDTKLGLRFEFDDSGFEVKVDLDEFRDAARNKGADFLKVFKTSDDDEEQSLFQVLSGPLDSLKARITSKIGTIGSLLDRVG